MKPGMIFNQMVIDDHLEYRLLIFDYRDLKLAFDSEAWYGISVETP